jgi:N-methylhydantoinase B
MLRSGGGGGFGDPLRRDIDLVADDIFEGYVSPRAGASDYGVVLDLHTGKLDEARTAELRRDGDREVGAAGPGIYEPGSTPIPIPG